MIITGRSSSIVEKRCKELGILQLYQGIQNKKDKLDEILENTDCTYKEVAYIGDDINDLSGMEIIKAAGGVIGCPADAVREFIECF